MFTIKYFLFSVLLLPVLIFSETTNNDIQSKKSILSNTSRISPQPFLEVVEGLLKSLRSNDIAKAYTEYTATEFRKQTSLADFQKLVEKYKVLNNNKLFQFQSFYVENDTVSFGGDLHSEKGETIPVEFDFISEDDKWKILGIQIYQNELSLPNSENL